MRHVARALVALAILAALPTVRLAAQQARPQLFVAGGLEASVVANDPVYPPGLTGQLGLEWWKPDRRLGWRFGVFGLQRQRDFPMTTSGPFTSHLRARVVGLEANATYALTRSRIRPYLVGGLGLYRTSVEERILDPGANNLTTAKSATYNAGVSAGLGISAPVPGGEVFLEGRFLGLSGGHETRLTPLVLGFRFNF